MFPLAVPVNEAVIVPALKFPDESLLQIADAVFADAAAFASTSARCTFEAVDPPTLATVAATLPVPEAVTSLVKAVMPEPPPPAAGISTESAKANEENKASKKLYRSSMTIPR